MLECKLNEILRKCQRIKNIWIYVRYNLSYFLKVFIENSNITIDNDTQNSLNNDLEYYEKITAYISIEIKDLKPFHKSVIGIKGFFLQNS